MKKLWVINSLPHGILLIALLYLAVVVLFHIVNTKIQQQYIVVLTPLNGQTFLQGDTVTFVVQPGPGLTFSNVIVGCHYKLGTRVDEVAPFELAFVVPNDLTGGVTCLVTGNFPGGGGTSAEVTFNIKAPTVRI